MDPVAKVRMVNVSPTSAVALAQRSDSSLRDLNPIRLIRKITSEAEKAAKALGTCRNMMR
jgi:hypothetical protein